MLKDRREINRNSQCWCGSALKYKKCHYNVDQKLLHYHHLGYKLPKPSLILNKTQIEGVRRSGELNTAILDYIADKLEVGMSTAEINRLVHEETLKLGGRPATLGFSGYPKSLCTSVNDEVCHGIPSKDVKLRQGDIINIDVSTVYNGYYSDSARVFPLGRVNEEARKLIDVSKASLELGLSKVVPWTSMRNIGNSISSFVEEHGYSIASGIGGHGIGLKFHEEPFVSYERNGTDMLLVPGMIFTIEPAVNQGGSEVFEDALNGWTIYTDDGSLSAQWEVTVLVTETGYETLAY